MLKELYRKPSLPIVDVCSLNLRMKIVQECGNIIMHADLGKNTTLITQIGLAPWRS